MQNVFTDRITQLRKEKRRTQADTAKNIGVSRTTYGEYERGNIMPPATKIQRIADIYGVSVDYLVGNTDFKWHNEAKALDIAAQISVMLSYLDNSNSALVYDNAGVTDTERTLLKMGLQNLATTITLFRNSAAV